MTSIARNSFRVAGALAAGLLLVPAAVHADLRIEERNTSLESIVTRWITIKGVRRAIVSRADATGTLYNAGARHGAYVEIARPDKDLIWELQPQERSYREVTFEQFKRLLQKGIQAPRTANEQFLRSNYRSLTTAIEVVPTGKTRKVAGYPAEQVMARAVVGVQSLSSGNTLNFTFDQEVWLTKDEAILKEVRPFEEAYAETFGSALTLQQAQVTAGEWADAFITHLRSLNDRVRALGGFPLAATTTVTEEAVAQNKGEKGSSRKFVVASSEVRSLQIETVPDSEFELPGGYINSETKVAVAGPAPVAAPEREPVMVVATAPRKDGPKDGPTVVAVRPPLAPALPAPLRGAAGEGSAADPRIAFDPSRPTVASGTPGPAATAGVSTPAVPPASVAPAREPRTPPVVVTAAPPVAITNNYPILVPAGGGLARTQNVPPPVTVDEIEAPKTKRRRRR